MAYDSSLGDATSRVRFSVQDVDDAAPLLPEATYTALVARYAGTYADSAGDEARATVAAAEALLTKFAQQPDSVEVTGAVKVAWKSRLAAWRELANALRVELGLVVIGATDSTMRVGALTRAAADGTEWG